MTVASSARRWSGPKRSRPESDLTLILPDIWLGHTVSDVMVILGRVEIVMGEVDRSFASGCGKAEPEPHGLAATQTPEASSGAFSQSPEGLYPSKILNFVSRSPSLNCFVMNTRYEWWPMRRLIHSSTS